MKVHVLISGRVQGVGFRLAARRRLTELGLAGWVENLADGRVEAEFAGETIAVKKMLEWCREGPPLAQVSRVEYEFIRVTGHAGYHCRNLCGE